MSERIETCDGWFVQERTAGLLWHVTRDNWNEDDTPARQVYYADIQLDPRVSCEHQQWYLARWTPAPDDVLTSPDPPGDWPYYNMNVFTMPGRFESVDDAVGAVVLMNHYQHYQDLYRERLTTEQPSG